MRAFRARTANLNTMHEIMCTFHNLEFFFQTAKTITTNDLFTYSKQHDLRK